MNKIIEKEFKEELIPFYGNKFLIGNGYLGYRGTLEEFRAEQKVALNLNGIYDQVKDKWCESINCYNPFYTVCKVNNQELNILTSKIISHEMELDLLTACLYRKTIFQVENTHITIETKKFASMTDIHNMGMEYCISCDSELELDIETGIDLKIWDLNGPHLDIKEICEQKKNFLVKGKSKQHQYDVIVKENLECINDNWMNEIIDYKLLHQIHIKLEKIRLLSLKK